MALETNRRNFLLGVAAGSAAAALVAVPLSVSPAEADTSNYAELLRRALRKRGVKIAPRDDLKDARIGAEALGPDNIKRPMTQLHVDAEEAAFDYNAEACVDALADVVATRGRYIQFGRLWVPPHGKGTIKSVGHRHDQVLAREITMYEIASDKLMTRLDVLFAVIA